MKTIWSSHWHQNNAELAIKMELDVKKSLSELIYFLHRITFQMELVQEIEELSPSLSLYTSDYNRAVNKSKQLFECLKQQLDETQNYHQALDEKLRDKNLSPENARLARHFDSLRQRLMMKHELGLHLLAELNKKFQLERHLILQLAEQEQTLNQFYAQNVGI